MAVVYPNANGNWSTVANWYSAGAPYGSLPLSGDTVYANGKTIAIDVSTVTVVSLNTAASAPALAGGGFTCAIACTITASIDARSGTTRVLLTDNLVGTTVTIIGNIWGGPAINAITHNNTGTLTITGNIVGGTLGGISAALTNTLSSAIINHTGNISATATSQGVRINCTYNLIGNITSGLLNGAASFVANSPCILNVNGNISAGAGYYSLEISAGSTVNISSQQTLSGGTTTAINNSGVINLNNNLFGPLAIAGLSAYFINNLNICVVNGNITMQNYSVGNTSGIIFNVASLTVNGNITGGTVANTIAVNNSSTNTITVNGNITGGSHATNTPAVYSLTAGTIDINGNCIAGAYPAIYSSSLTATNILRGNITNVAGVPAYFTYNIKVSPTAVQTVTMQTTTNVDRLFSTSNVSVGAPATTNVRSGIVYGSTNELTGTMIVPTPANVRNGVLTDNTVGTADLTISEFWDINASTLTTAGSIGDRVRNVSTVQTLGDQLTALTN
jgi:hypothetical protein